MNPFLRLCSLLQRLFVSLKFLRTHIAHVGGIQLRPSGRAAADDVLCLLQVEVARVQGFGQLPEVRLQRGSFPCIDTKQLPSESKRHLIWFWVTVKAHCCAINPFKIIGYYFHCCRSCFVSFMEEMPNLQQKSHKCLWALFITVHD